MMDDQEYKPFRLFEPDEEDYDCDSEEEARFYDLKRKRERRRKMRNYEECGVYE